MTEPERYVNVIPAARLKKETLPSSDNDVVYCRLCPKGFASEVALRNHAGMEHTDAYAVGDPSVWTSYDRPKKAKTDAEKLILYKTKQVISEMAPTSVVTLASNDVSYIIIKADDGTDVKKKRTDRSINKKDKEDKIEKVIARKEKETEPITGPFECLQPSVLVADGTCHQIFFSCCEYSIHFRDEHTRRRKGLKCQVCEKPLSCSGEEQVAPFPCEICGAGFQSSKELSEHTSIAHVKLKPFECSICHKRFTQQGGVLQHMRMHTGDRPFPCTICSKSFTQKSGLDQHLRIHTKVKPYRCVVCNKTFCQSVHLRQHMRTHTNVAPFQCGICDKRFKQSSHLNYHLKNHNPAMMTDEQKAKYAELIGVITMNEALGETVQLETEVDTEWCQTLNNTNEVPLRCLQ